MCNEWKINKRENKSIVLITVLRNHLILMILTFKTLSFRFLFFKAMTIFSENFRINYYFFTFVSLLSSQTFISLDRLSIRLWFSKRFYTAYIHNFILSRVYSSVKNCSLKKVQLRSVRNSDLKKVSWVGLRLWFLHVTALFRELHISFIFQNTEELSFYFCTFRVRSNSKVLSYWKRFKLTAVTLV